VLDGNVFESVIAAAADAVVIFAHAVSPCAVSTERINGGGAVRAFLGGAARARLAHVAVDGRGVEAARRRRRARALATITERCRPPVQPMPTVT
jgi:hypothetical protein